MSHTHPLHFHPQRKYVKFQDTRANAVKEEVAPGTKEKFGRMKDDKNKDVDSVAAEFILHKHRAWALQKSTTMYPAS
ncbi:hypothetical protein PR202_gb03610 [Eleusine coracana subsp. coracana]|uniref:Uncharacterized protein n=1 Tax=Eleusine coracana subsp. coracana TaxID=191504 RepID=A0AAV5BZC9_ELECO|nr:hypothetical protein QOZ80_1BG0098000 [Eleusine coracana subsp. coracana]KAK3166614.1 hypothetical protein QOZ80_1AG0048100 [Eleusine coracana subsp. coracana]GJM91769.1 hypothetical protein PR202_ga08179 [Eleusine coracana subsp. coracana]GJN16606.1 hypothetical protein PR202_gb03610 [Eleusine coracana subsp. coracana]